MQFQNKVYSVAHNFILAPSDAASSIFDLSDNYYYLSIKSVTIDYSIINLATQEIIPNAQNNVLQIQFLLGGAANMTIARNFENFVNVNVANLWDGNEIRFFNPGTYHFENFIVMQTIPVFITCGNNDLINGYHVITQLIIEIVRI